jgi:hypothetical protein
MEPPIRERAMLSRVFNCNILRLRAITDVDISSEAVTMLKCGAVLPGKHYQSGCLYVAQRAETSPPLLHLMLYHHF